MTTAQSAGVVDMSGVISMILKSYQDVVTTYQQMVTGDPAAIQAAGTKLEDQATALATASTDIGRRATTLATTWEGSASTAYQTATRQLTGQLDQVDQTVAQEAQQLGNSAVNAAKTLAQQIGETLAGLFNVVMPPDFSKHAGSIDLDKKKALKQALVNQDWFKNWYRQTYGTDPDPKNLRLGTLSWFSDQNVLDGRRRPRSSPSWFGNTGWYSVTGDGVASAGTPLKANTPFGSLGSPPPDASTAARLMHDTNITLGSTGNQTMYDGSLVDDKTSGAVSGFGTLQGNAEFDAGLRATDNGSLSVYGGQFQASGDLKTTLVDANATGSYTAGPLETQASGDAMVGGDLSGHLTAGTNGLAAHVNAFAGAQVSGTANADVAGVGVGVKGSLQAGIGAQFDGQATWDNGHIVVSAKAGAALGVGASVGTNIDIDVPKMVNTVQEYGGAAVTAVQNAAGSVEYAASQAATALGNAMSKYPAYPPGVW
jgi:uncharacterized protein YukE